MVCRKGKNPSQRGVVSVIDYKYSIIIRENRPIIKNFGGL